MTDEFWSILMAAVVA